MVLKSTLRDTIQEVFTEREVDDTDLADDLLDRLCTAVEVLDDDDEEETER